MRQMYLFDVNSGRIDEGVRLTSHDHKLCSGFLGSFDLEFKSFILLNVLRGFNF